MTPDDLVFVAEVGIPPPKRGRARWMDTAPTFEKDVLYSRDPKFKGVGVDVDTGAPYGDLRYKANKDQLPNLGGFRYATCFVVYDEYRGHIQISKVTKHHIHGHVISMFDDTFPQGTLLKVPLGSVYYYGSTQSKATPGINKWIRENY